MAIRNAPRRGGHTTRAVAVHIGNNMVRAVEMEMRGGEVRLARRGCSPTPPGAWDDLEAARDRLAQAIRAAMTAGGITATHVVSAIPRRLVTLKYARLPHAAPEQVRGMVQYEAQQYIPFPLEEVVLDHRIVSDESEDMTTVMIAATRRSLVESLLGAFDKAGLEVIRLSVSALALAELAQNEPMPVALLDVGASEMDMAVVSAGKLLFTRATMLAEGSDGIDSNHVLAAEVARSLAAYQNDYRAQPVSKLLLAGSRQQLDCTADALGGLLDTPVGRMNGRLLPAGDPETPAYATALGLALEGGDGGAHGVNLVPSTREERKVAARRRVNTLVAIGSAVVVGACALLFIEQSLAAQKREGAEAARQNRKLELTNTAYKTIKAGHDATTRVYQTVSTGLDRKIPAVEVIKALSDALPKGNSVYLTQLAFERGGAVTIHGNAKSETAATDLVLGLQGSGAFGEVRLGYLGDAQADLGAPGSTPNAPQKKLKPGELMSFIVICRAPRTMGDGTQVAGATAPKASAVNRDADTRQVAQAPGPDVRTTPARNARTAAAPAVGKEARP